MLTALNLKDRCDVYSDVCRFLLLETTECHIWTRFYSGDSLISPQGMPPELEKELQPSYWIAQLRITTIAATPPQKKRNHWCADAADELIMPMRWSFWGKEKSKSSPRGNLKELLLRYLMMMMHWSSPFGFKGLQELNFPGTGLSIARGHWWPSQPSPPSILLTLLILLMRWYYWIRISSKAIGSSSPTFCHLYLSKPITWFSGWEMKSQGQRSNLRFETRESQKLQLSRNSQLNTVDNLNLPVVG